MVWINKPRRKVNSKNVDYGDPAIQLLCVVEWCVLEDGCFVVGGGIPTPCIKKKNNTNL